MSEQNRKKRLIWARAHKNWSLSDWKQVLWSDESPFVLRFKNTTRVWRLPNERFKSFALTGTVKHDKKINVWGCFSYSGVGHIHWVQGLMDQAKYKQILIHHMRPSSKKLFGNENFIFQQDNDPKHTAKTVKKYLENHFKVLEWPAQSPDLNPIENLWNYLNTQMKDRKPQNEKQLFEVIKSAWNGLNQNILHKLVEVMPRRCLAVIESKGWPTKY